MRGLANIVLIMTLGVFAFSCVETYWPSLGGKYEDALVVEGLITDKPGPYEVLLSVSTDVNEPKYIPYNSCTVRIKDDLGDVEMLKEVDPGRYVTHANGLRGEAGRSYQLSIDTPKGKRYESPFQMLEAALPIDSVYWHVEMRESYGLDHDLEGYQIYLNTAKASRDSTYLMWQLNATYKYNSIHRVRYVFDGQMKRVGTTDTLHTCWRTDPVKEIITFTTRHLSEPRLLGFPLKYVSTETRELSIRYSLLIEQLQITKTAYEYWQSLREQMAEESSLFTKQPYQIKGNISNPDDENDVVFGFFTVAGQTEKRVFLDPPEGANFYYPTDCNMYTDDLYTMLYSMRSEWPVLLAGKVTEYGTQPALPGSKSCIDCTANGGTIEPPDFWETKFYNHE